jgi:hypothetical protein
MNNHIIPLALILATACPLLAASKKQTNTPAPAQAVQTQPEQKQLSHSDRLISKTKAFIQKYNNQFYFGSGIACGAATIAVLVTIALKKGYLGQKSLFYEDVLRQQLRKADAEGVRSLHKAFRSEDKNNPLSHKNYHGNAKWAEIIIKGRLFGLHYRNKLLQDGLESTTRSSIYFDLGGSLIKYSDSYQIVDEYLYCTQVDMALFQELFNEKAIQDSWGKVLVHAYLQQRQMVDKSYFDEMCDAYWNRVKHPALLDVIEKSETNTESKPKVASRAAQSSQQYNVSTE